MAGEFDVENRLQPPEHRGEQHRTDPAHGKAHNQGQCSGDYVSLHAVRRSLPLIYTVGALILGGHKANDLRCPSEMFRNRPYFMRIHLPFG